jgi:hypothetical protein
MLKSALELGPRRHVPIPDPARCGHGIRFLKPLETRQLEQRGIDNTTTTMRWLFSLLLLGLLAVVEAASSSGKKLLVVVEELADKSKYSKYLGDLEGSPLFPALFFLFSYCYFMMMDHVRLTFV